MTRSFDETRNSNAAQTIAQRLLAVTGQSIASADEAVSSYLQTYLVEHIAHCGNLDLLIADKNSKVLDHLDQARLASVLARKYFGTGKTAMPQTAEAILRMRQILIDLPPRDRSPARAVGAALCGHAPPPDDGQSRWWPLWTEQEIEPFSVELVAHESAISTLLGVVDGGLSLIVTGDAHGEYRVTDVLSQQTIAEFVEPAARSADIVRVGDEILLAVVRTDGRIVGYHLRSGKETETDLWVEDCQVICSSVSTSRTSEVFIAALGKARGNIFDGQSREPASIEVNGAIGCALMVAAEQGPTFLILGFRTGEVEVRRSPDFLTILRRQAHIGAIVSMSVVQSTDTIEVVLGGVSREGGQFRTIRAPNWDFEGGARLAHSSMLYAVSGSQSADGRQIVATSGRQAGRAVLSLWDLRASKPFSSVVLSDRKQIHVLHLLRSGGSKSLLATGSDDGAVRLWAASGPAESGISRHAESIVSSIVECGRDGNSVHVLAASITSASTIFSIDAMGRVQKLSSGPSLSSAEASFWGSWCIAAIYREKAGDAEELRLYSSPEFRLLCGSPLTGHATGVSSICAGARLIVIVCFDDGSVDVWHIDSPVADADSLSMTRQQVVTGLDEAWSVAISPRDEDSTIVVGGSFQGRACTALIETTEEGRVKVSGLLDFESDNYGNIRSLAISAGSQSVMVAGTWGGSVIVTDWPARHSSSEPLKKLMDRAVGVHGSRVRGVAVTRSADERSTVIATGGADGVVRVWEIELGSLRCKVSFPVASEVWSLCFLDERRIVVGTGNGMGLYRMDVRSPGETPDSWDSHTAHGVSPIAPASSGSSQELSATLIDTLRRNEHDPGSSMIERSVRVAMEEHGARQLKDGRLVFSRVMSVANLLAELGMPSLTVSAWMLASISEVHDPSDSDPGFPEGVSKLVEQCRQVSRIAIGPRSTRGKIAALLRDLRVAVIMIADQVQKARDAHKLFPEEDHRYWALETLGVFAPVAGRLGINAIKSELEDLTLAAQYPEIFDEVARLVAEMAPGRDELQSQATAQLGDDLRAAQVLARIVGRQRNYYSIFRQLVDERDGHSTVFDLISIRVIVGSVSDCYVALGVIHSRWAPVPGQFKDYIALPEVSSYQSLRTIVLGPQSKPMDVQILTEGMYRSAELGIAAAKTDLDAIPNANRQGGDGDMAWVLQLLNWQRATAEPGELLASMRPDVNSAKIYAFTPKGDVHVLPDGASPVDFAYAVHTEIGHQAVRARINGRSMSLKSTLRNGDVVEILTTLNGGGGPDEEWLEVVRSRKARKLIRRFLSRTRRQKSAEIGRKLISDELAKAGLRGGRLLAIDRVDLAAGDLGFTSATQMFSAVGDRSVRLDAVLDQLARADRTLVSGERQLRLRKLSGPGSIDFGIALDGERSASIRLSKCCNPVPFDEILGFSTRGGQVSVHRSQCPNALRLLSRDRSWARLDVAWLSSANVIRTSLQAEALRRSDLLSDIIEKATDEGVRVLSATLSTRTNICQVRVTLETFEATAVSRALESMRGVPGVFDVYRVIGA